MKIRTKANAQKVIDLLAGHMGHPLKFLEWYASCFKFGSEAILGIHHPEIFKMEFEGKIDQHGFVWRRIVNYGMNPFRPIIMGKVLDSNEGCVLEIDFRLPSLWLEIWTMLTFLLAWAAIILFRFGSLTSLGKTQNLSFAILILLVWSFFPVGFSLEVHRTKQFLQKTLRKVVV